MKLCFGVALLVVLQIAQLNAFRDNGGRPQGGNQGSNNERGSWGVSVNKDKGRGPQIRTEGQGNIYTSKDGNWRVDGHGHHEAGRGRKPEMGGGVSVTGRWRRAADQDDFADELPTAIDANEYQVAERSKRQAPQVQGQHGSVGVTVNHDKGQGPQVRTDASANFYKSPNLQVTGNGYHEFGRGRKPDYGLRTEANANIYSSRNGNWHVTGHGYHDMGRGRKPDYGVGVGVKGRFRRDLDNQEETDDDQYVEASETRIKRQSQQGQHGSVGVSINHDKGRGPQIRTDASTNIYTSPNSNWQVRGNGFHEAGRGRKPDYGVGVRVTGRFRRDLDFDEDFLEDQSDTLGMRLKRSWQQGGQSYPGSTAGSSQGQSSDRGSWGVSVNKNKGQGPQIRTEAQGNVYKSPNGNVRVDAQGHHEAGKGRKPDYGGSVKVGGRW